MRKNLTGSIFAFVVSAAIACTAAGTFTPAAAASLKTNIFTETLEDESLEDSNKWTTSKDGSGIDIANVGTQKLCFTPAANGQISFRYGEEVSLSAKQYVEYTVTFEGMPAEAVIDFMFAPTAYAPGETADIAECVSFYADSWLRGEMHSSSARKIGGAWGNEAGEGEVIGLQWVNGNALLGAVEPTTGKYSWKVRTYDDGTTIYYVADAYKTNWFLTAMVGYATSNVTWQTSDTGSRFVPCTKGYPTVVVRNAPEAYIGQFEVGVYDYDEVFTGEPDAPFPDGTLSGEKYVDDTSAADKTGLVAIAGSLGVKAPLRALFVDNAADDDLLCKKTKLSAPANNFADDIYTLAFEFVIPELEGNAKCVLYVGADAAKSTAGATAIEFFKNGSGKVSVRAGDESAETDISVSDVKFSCTIAAHGDMTNDVYIDGVKKISFTKDIVDKFVAVGTVGVTATDKAQIGVVSADFKRYDYKQGTGGDFTETFDNGTYNSANMAFAYNVENLQDYMYADAEGGNLVIENVAWTGVVSTKEMYGDFEFTFEVSEFGTTLLEDGSEAPCNFNICWGRPAPEADYSAGGCGLYMVWGNDFNIMGLQEVRYATGYGPWCSFSLPTDKTDEDGKPLGRSGSIWDYNFSEGNLVFKTIKKGDRVELYMYTADSDPDSPSRNNPISVIVNDYSYGCVGICGLPTGKPTSMKVSSFSIKNLDEHKADDLKVGGAEDVVDLDLTPEEEESIFDPFENESKSEPTSSATENQGGGCGGAIGGISVLSALCAAAFVILKKKH